MSRPRPVEWIGCGRGEGEGRPALLGGRMVASREDNGSQHDIHGISYRRGAAGERRQTTTWAVGSEE
jgi:hypothetical protein